MLNLFENFLSIFTVHTMPLNAYKNKTHVLDCWRLARHLVSPQIQKVAAKHSSDDRYEAVANDDRWQCAIPENRPQNYSHHALKMVIFKATLSMRHSHNTCFITSSILSIASKRLVSRTKPPSCGSPMTPTRRCARLVSVLLCAAKVSEVRR